MRSMVSIKADFLLRREADSSVINGVPVVTKAPSSTSTSLITPEAGASITRVLATGFAIHER